MQQRYLEGSQRCPGTQHGGRSWETRRQEFDAGKPWQVMTSFGVMAERFTPMPDVFEEAERQNSPAISGRSSTTSHPSRLAPSDAYYPDGLGEGTYDPEEARSLLAAAGFRTG